MSQEGNTELAWAAGFFDGEGYVGVVSRRKVTGLKAPRRYYHLNCGITQVHTEVLERFRNAVGGVGIISGPSGTVRVRVGHQPIYYYKINRQNDILTTFTKLRPYLSSIKRQQFEEAIEQVKDIRRQPFGKRGIVEYTGV